ncbi:uncharacterized protein LOC123199237 [Mangifera indica]|uniref:uncharacterized protein LOC123199237 n=1 Tax=Mangifera indica TaxID=29780 RepID=UPI001CF9A6C4|nr:uncharacterized protein LOC123199237 [Mangifera indica]
MLKLGVLLPMSPVLLVSSTADIRVQYFYKRQVAERSSSSGVHSHYEMVGWILAGMLWFLMTDIHSKHGLCSSRPSAQGLLSPWLTVGNKSMPYISLMPCSLLKAFPLFPT